MKQDEKTTNLWSEDEPGEVDGVVELLDVAQLGDGGDTKHGEGPIEQAAHEAGAGRAAAVDSSVPVAMLLGVPLPSSVARYLLRAA